MSSELEQKAQRLVSLGDRLADALAGDIESLKRGRPRDMKLIEPEIQQLTLLYGRDAKGLDAAQAKTLPAPLRALLETSTKRLHEKLGQHARLLTRMRNASEGMIRAVAGEVETRRATARPYSAHPLPPPKSTGAMLYNNVV